MIFSKKLAGAACVLLVAGERIQQVSVDEAYVDVNESRSFGTVDDALEAALPLARSLKLTIREQRGLSASIGVASNKLLAKLASDF